MTHQVLGMGLKHMTHQGLVGFMGLKHMTHQGLVLGMGLQDADSKYTRV